MSAGGGGGWEAAECGGPPPPPLDSAPPLPRGEVKSIPDPHQHYLISKIVIVLPRIRLFTKLDRRRRVELRHVAAADDHPFGVALRDRVLQVLLLVELG